MTSTKNFTIVNFGCRASQSEGAAIHEELVKGCLGIADSPYSADVVVVNTCTVTAEADKEARQLIRRIGSRNPKAEIIVTGCYAQRAPDEIADFPGVRYVVGNSHKALVGSLALQEHAHDNSPSGRAEVFCSSIFERELKPSEHLGSSGRTRAIVKVQDGCNANCSFCIIPTVRGRSRSVEPELIAGEVAQFVVRGYKEIVFSGIHLGTYGRDLPAKTSLVRLVGDVLEANRDLARLRLSSIEPLEVTSDLLDLVVGEPRIAHHLHIPLQSGSFRILREMRRPYTPSQYAQLVDDVRSRLPYASIGADVMVGFPGETDDDFIDTYRLIERSPLTYLHVFPYSVRPGTLAEGMPNHVPHHVAHFRVKALRQLALQKNEAFRRAMIGRTLQVLVLDSGEGLSENFLRVDLPSGFPVNDWVEVRATRLTEDGLDAAHV